MGLEANPSQNPRDQDLNDTQLSEGRSLQVATAAKEDLRKILADSNIVVSLGIIPMNNRSYGIGVRVQPSHGLTRDQIADLKSIREHNGVPVDVKVFEQDPKPRSASENEQAGA